MGSTDFSMTELFYHGSLLPNVTEFNIQKTFITSSIFFRLSHMSVKGKRRLSHKCTHVRLGVSVISVQGQAELSQ